MTGAATTGPGRPLRSHLLVLLQLVAIVVCCLPAPAGATIPAALALCAAGAALGAATLWHNRPGNFSVYPEPKSGAALVTSGPYALVRHPMYGALVLVMTGVALYNAGWPNAIGLAILAAAISGKVALEERYLRARFPGYAGYAQATKRFIPFVY